MFTFLGKWAVSKTIAAHIHLNWWRLRLRRALKRSANRRLVRIAKDATLSVQINAPVGLFAHLSWCLEIVAYCEKHKLHPNLMCISKQYGDGERDWFNVLFRQRHAARRMPAQARTIETMHIQEFEELPFFQSFAPDFTFAEMTRLQQKYFPVSKHITEKMNAYVKRHFGTGTVVGCHYRGTDKGVEATRIAYEEMTAALRNAIAQYPANAALFVATDEAAFLAHVRENIPQARVFSADHRRSTDGRALHMGANPHGWSAGEEALIDSLLLSRCAHLVKSPSALSAWAKVFNPALKVTLVGRPFAHAMFFPESVLVKEHDAMRHEKEKSIKPIGLPRMIPEAR